jgi:hypothetical protein
MPLRTLDDVVALSAEVKRRGFRALKPKLICLLCRATRELAASALPEGRASGSWPRASPYQQERARLNPNDAFSGAVPRRPPSMRVSTIRRYYSTPADVRLTRLALAVLPATCGMTYARTFTCRTLSFILARRAASHGTQRFGQCQGTAEPLPRISGGCVPYPGRRCILGSPESKAQSSHSSHSRCGSNSNAPNTRCAFGKDA